MVRKTHVLLVEVSKKVVIDERSRGHARARVEKICVLVDCVIRVLFLWYYCTCYVYSMLQYRTRNAISLPLGPGERKTLVC